MGDYPMQGVIVLTLFKTPDGVEHIDLTVSKELSREQITDALAETLVGLQEQQK